ncbi:MAG TPA: IclR family transcriptional regulator [Burkholderiaceae bacterium]|nr:IclR family transcriptional regulator [Burkholderiaceae bacterium]
MNDALDLDASAKYVVPGLERGLRILSEFSRNESRLSAPELARRLDIPRSTVFRLLSTLELLGFVEREEGGRDYSLGLAVLRLGFECLASKELTELGRPVLDRLRDQVQLPCNLVVRDGRSVVYVARSLSQTPFSSMVHLGTRLPAHATLFGRLLLRDLSYEKLRKLYPEEQLQTFTDHTPKTVDDLFRQLQADKGSRYLFVPGYFEPHISTLVVPVYGAGGAIVAAIGVTVAADHSDPAQITLLKTRACQAAAELSQLLDHIVPMSGI